MSDDEDRYAAGLKTRRSVLGDAYVNRALGSATPFDGEFQRFVTEAAWGSVWSREGISKRERSMVTLALLAGLGHHEEFALHLRATRNTGATPEDIREVLLHVAVYAGVPAANAAFRIARQVYAETEGGAA